MPPALLICSVGRSLGVDGLPGVQCPDGDDTDGDQSRGDAEDADVGLDLINPVDYLGLLAGSLGAVIGEEEPLLLVAGELSAIGEDGDETGGDGSPDGEHGRYGVNCGFEAHDCFFPLGAEISVEGKGPGVSFTSM
jgi:hypothetical protein